MKYILTLCSLDSFTKKLLLGTRNYGCFVFNLSTLPVLQGEAHVTSMFLYSAWVDSLYSRLPSVVFHDSLNEYENK